MLRVFLVEVLVGVVFALVVVLSAHLMLRVGDERLERRAMPREEPRR